MNHSPGTLSPKHLILKWCLFFSEFDHSWILSVYKTLSHGSQMWHFIRTSSENLLVALHTCHRSCFNYDLPAPNMPQSVTGGWTPRFRYASFLPERLFRLIGTSHTLLFFKIVYADPHLYLKWPTRSLQFGFQITYGAGSGVRCILEYV